MRAFLVFFLLLYAGGCFYLGLRFFAWLKLLIPTLHPALFWLLFGGLCIGMLGLFFVRSGWQAYSSGIWIAVFVYALMLTLSSDILRKLMRLLGAEKPLAVLSPVVSGAVVLLLLFVTIAGGMVNARTVCTKAYTIAIEGLTEAQEGMKVAVVSDMHLGAVYGAAHTQKIVDAVTEADADVVLLAGDIFDGDFDRAKEVGKIQTLLASINSRLGVYAVFGNHDVNSTVGASADFLALAGVTLLHNESVMLTNGVTLVGRADYSQRWDDGGRLSLSQMGYDRSGTVIVLDHQPQSDAVYEAAAGGADLMVSGHTHRGQIFPGNWMVRLLYPTSYGVGTYGAMTLAVTSGAATWGPPLRVGTQSEIMVLTLTSI